MAGQVITIERAAPRDGIVEEPEWSAKGYCLGDPKFGASLLIEPNDKANIAAINKAIETVATEKWGAKAAGHLALMRKTDKVALHDGDLKAQYAGFAGMMFVSSRSAARPGNRQLVMSAMDHGRLTR